jgi:RimJ/RimL family protein N-acetyltransferase
MFPESFTTARLLLRPVRMEDAAAIFDGYAQDAEVTRYLTWRPHASIDETEAYVRACIRAENARIYMLVERATDQIMGALDLRKTGHARLDYGCVLMRRRWGQGLMTEAVAEVADWALRQPSIWRIGAVADVENVASIRVMEKAGFQREGLLRRWLIHPNRSAEPRDCISLARTR